MTKQEMAEWLAEKFLPDGFWENQICYEGKAPYGDELIEFIYSPDGFFAVWDAVLAKKGYKGVLAAMKIALEVSVVPEYLFEAFYNAVYQAMK